MVSIITGDIINSRKIDAAKWLGKLKVVLKQFGSTPKYWETYSGDSFQLRVNDPATALMAAINIKAAIKSLPRADVRMSIGIGGISYEARKITECNGEAFVHSGEKFEQLKREKQNLAIKTPWNEFDAEMNLYLKLALVAMDAWTANAAEIVRLAMANPGKSQEVLGKKLGIRQNAVSNRLKRANYDALLELDKMYGIKLNKLV
jgi:ribosome-binding protein aMBF1 (putative translation factor)